MNREELEYLYPYLISLALSVGILIYAWQRRKVRGAGAYTWFIGGQTLSIFGFIMELVNSNLQTKIFWDKFQWFTEGTVVVFAFLIFAIQFTEYKIRRPKLFWTMALIVPIVFNILVLTDGKHHLIYPNPHLTSDYPFPDLEYNFTIAVDMFSLYVYSASLFGIGLLIRRIIRPHNLYRSQLATIAIGFLIPLAFSAFALLNIQITPQRDISPFSLAIGNLIVAWGLFRYHLFDIVPIARERIMDNMTDPVVVTDALDRVVDVNQAALSSIRRKSSQVIGQPIKMAFVEWLGLFEQIIDLDQTVVEIAPQIRGNQYYYELSISPIRDPKNRLIGRIFVAHNITKRKMLEDGYRQLSEELEQRVTERTEELADAYNTTLEGWAKALELRDKETEGHSRRVTELTLKLARAVGVQGQALDDIRRGAILHDIGKMAIPDEILRKAGPLTHEERKIVMKHPIIANELLAPIHYLRQALEIPYCHHEKWDGTGYPRGLQGSDIPLAARIFAVADVWDAIQSDRPYNQGWTREKATQYIREQSSKHFDPDIVNIFLELIKQGGI
ncbi:MAG: HD domain-containing protein [Chloroflexi bacterium]|nr:HD domain-containing protein [Chloroflexota bacterium]MBI3339458.1 HD domain-containing protein [Chloroflexota bacterium]